MDIVIANFTVAKNAKQVLTLSVASAGASSVEPACATLHHVNLLNPCLIVEQSCHLQHEHTAKRDYPLFLNA